MDQGYECKMRNFLVLLSVLRVTSLQPPPDRRRTTARGFHAPIKNLPYLGPSLLFTNENPFFFDMLPLLRVPHHAHSSIWNTFQDNSPPMDLHD